MAADLDWLTGTIRWGDSRNGDTAPWSFAVTVQNLHGVAHLSAGRGELPRRAVREIGELLANHGFTTVVWETVMPDGSVRAVRHSLCGES